MTLQPERMPIRGGGAWRKRWRYVGVFGDEVMACAARVEVGPGAQTFWAIWDRSSRRLWERTRLRLPGRRGDVWTEDRSGRRVEHSPGDGAVVRIDGRADGSRVEARLSLGGGEWAEVVCPTAAGSYVWTRKRADIPADADVRIGDRSLRVEGRAVEDESAGYHPRHTVWSWSAGVGRTTDERSVGWNLVSGVNDPIENSERAIWVDGHRQAEPGPVEFVGFDEIVFDDDSRLAFTAEAERRRSENLGFIRYAYRQPFGRFAGTLPGGVELESGLGVVEHHDAHW